ncbi:hypothetical protein [Sulfuricurvum sp.]|uniref:hypothetical protein n=1 Tax=Sulfuricurvum sp. TaxID=2025608 RepID=UPI003BB18E74
MMELNNEQFGFVLAMLKDMMQRISFESAKATLEAAGHKLTDDQLNTLGQTIESKSNEVFDKVTKEAALIAYSKAH